MYFGEAIALYFTFIGFYTKALLFPVFLGILQLLIPTETVSFFCVFNVVWVTIFLEVSNKELVMLSISKKIIKNILNITWKL